MAAKNSRTSEAKKEAAEKQLADLQQKITDAVDAMTTPESWKDWLTVAAALPQYSFNNQVSLMAQAQERGVEPRAFASFTRWKDAGYSVNKGEKSYRIFGPVKRKLPFEKETGQPLTKEQASERSKSEVLWKPTVVGYKAVPTFEMGQTSAKDLGQIPDDMRPQHLSGPAPEGMWDAFVQFAKDNNTPVHLEPLDSLQGASGYFSHNPRTGEQRIVIGQELDDAAKVKTLIHECAHMHLHVGSEQSRSAKEIEAESTAFIVATRYGLDTSDYSFKYVGGWAGFNADAVKESGPRVVKAAGEILRATSPAESIAESTGSDAEKTSERAAGLATRAQSVESDISYSAASSRPRSMFEELGSQSFKVSRDAAPSAASTMPPRASQMTRTVSPEL
ncbi:MAG: ArdC family protein [Corynebacterium casei]|nr:ArdC family protein [Corynebacterium casei]